MKALCSDTVELEVGSHVRVRPSGRISGRFSMHGQVTAVHDSGTQKTYDVQLYQPCAAVGRRRYATTVQHEATTRMDAAEPAAHWGVKQWAAAKKMGSVQQGIEAPRLRHARDIVCTKHQITEAKKHAQKKGPGARPQAVAFSRVKVFGERRDYWSTFMRRSDVVRTAEASNRNVAMGVKYVRCDKMKRLWRKLVKEMTQQGLKPIDWKTFWLVARGREYTDMKAIDCCCPTCREKQA